MNWQFCSYLFQICSIDIISGGSRISQKEAPTPMGANLLFDQFFSRKLHENEDILAKRWGAHPLRPRRAAKDYWPSLGRTVRYIGIDAGVRFALHWLFTPSRNCLLFFVTCVAIFYARASCFIPSIHICTFFCTLEKNLTDTHCKFQF